MVDTADTNLLEDALADLKASPDAAKEEHLPVPSDKALTMSFGRYTAYGRVDSRSTPCPTARLP